MDYVIRGSVVSQTVPFSFSIMSIPIGFGSESAVCDFLCTKGDLSVRVRARHPFGIRDLQNTVAWSLASILNLIGFYQGTAISHKLEEMQCVDTGVVYDFNSRALPDTAFRCSETFRPIVGDVELDLAKLLHVQELSVATHHLRCAVVYTHFTAAHCRMALEALKNYFNPKPKQDGWKNLEKALRISPSTIAKFRVDAHDLRHSKMKLQSWEQRELALRTAWEVCHRFVRWKILGGNDPLDEKDFPEL